VSFFLSDCGVFLHSITWGVIGVKNEHPSCCTSEGEKEGWNSILCRLIRGGTILLNWPRHTHTFVLVAQDHSVHRPWMDDTSWWLCGHRHQRRQEASIRKLLYFSFMALKFKTKCISIATRAAIAWPMELSVSLLAQRERSVTRRTFDATSEPIPPPSSPVS